MAETAAIILAAGIAAMLTVAPQLAHAYIGPGAGITAIGTVIALLGAVLLAIVGFIWYPVKRLKAKLRDKKQAKKEGQGAGSA